MVSARLLIKKSTIGNIFVTIPWHTRDTAVYATFLNLAKSPIMSFLTLDWRQIFNDILIECSARYECSPTFHYEFFYQTFRLITSGLYKHVTSNENTWKLGMYLIKFDMPQINGNRQGEWTRQG